MGSLFKLFALFLIGYLFVTEYRRRIPCPGCSKPIKPSARSCPHCQLDLVHGDAGAAMRLPRLRRRMFDVIALVGCGVAIAIVIVFGILYYLTGGR